MPLINGQKMACEPCIRGHRSTKCTHANERLMVPVRKPGRPLSSCPHPSSKPCSCGQVTAAIPRKQKCSCGPSTPATQNGGPENGNANEDSGTKSPSPTGTTGTKSSSTNFRVQKNRKGSTRKQSIDPASIEKTDRNQLNVIPAPNGLNGAGTMSPTETASPISAISQYGPAGMTSMDQQLNSQPFMFPMLQQPIPNQMFIPPAVNGHMPQTTNETTSSGGVSQPSGSCCGGGVEMKRDDSDSSLLESQHVPRHNSISNAADGNSNVDLKTKSCCSSKAETFDQETSPTATPAGLQAHAGAMMMPQFPTPMATPPNMYPFFAHPGIFTYPPQYGTFMQPLQPDQWRQMMAAFNYGQIAQQHAFDMINAGMGNGLVTPTTTHPVHGQGLEAKTGGTSHHCSCGQACQCVGCATHPYNEATQNYIRSACNTMMEGQGNQHDAAIGNGDMVNGHGSEHGSSTSHTPQGASANSTTHLPAEGSATAPQTPSDAPSGLSDEQTLSANDFFFVTYPFGDSCAGESASCPCGDDCQCIGCVIHSNPDPSQSIDQQA